MQIEKLIMISIFTMILVFTIKSMYNQLRSNFIKTNESFQNPSSAASLEKLITATSNKPSDDDVKLAYQTVLRFIKSDFEKGAKIIDDMRNRFFSPTTQLKSDFDIENILQNPLILN
jgi:hypothetical protein